MPNMLNTLLRHVGLRPKEVRLLRHRDRRATKGRSVYELWRDARPQFEVYQSTQTYSGSSSRILLPLARSNR